MSSIKMRDRGLKRAFEGMLNDSRITKAEVDKLISSASDGPGLSKTETKDLQKLLSRAGDKFDADAKAALESFLAQGLGAKGPAAGAPAVSTVSERAMNVTALDQLVETFRSEIRDRAAAFSDPAEAFKLFAEYGGRLKALSAGADPREVDDVAEQLLAAVGSDPMLNAMADPEELAWLLRAIPSDVLAAAKADDDRYFSDLAARLIAAGAMRPDADIVAFTGAPMLALALEQQRGFLGEERHARLARLLVDGLVHALGPVP